MQTVKSNSKKKKRGHDGVKYILASLSLITSIGLWQHFSNKDGLAFAQTVKVDVKPENDLIHFQPLPTLVPVLLSGSAGQVQPPQLVNDNGLRQVTAPTKAPVVQPRIGLQQIIISNSATGINNEPITRTGSSK